MNICIPTLNAQDEFWRCVKSINESSVKCEIFVIDNGGYVVSSFENVQVYKPPENLGVAGSWNWFLHNVDEPRIITNDDVIFDRNAIELISKSYSMKNLLCPINLESSFSCFMLSQYIISVVGDFDEWISPHYAYFEDNDYSYRMGLAGFGTTRVEGAFVEHAGSSTLRHFGKSKMKEHHDKFRLARDHYIKKWGGGPGEEQFKTPFGN